MAAAATAAPRPASRRGGSRAPSVLRQGKYFCWTLPNPLISEIVQLKKMGRDDNSCRYIAWTLEDHGPEPLEHRQLVPRRGWTPHLQGVIEFDANVRPGWLKRHVSSRAHFENTHHRVKARSYCDPDSKDYVERKGGPGMCGIKCPFIEFGTPPVEDKSGKRTDLDAIRGIVDGGGSALDCFEAQFATMVRCHKGINMYSLLKRGGAECPEKTIIWIWGPTGCGKSELAAELASAYKGTFWKQTGTKWFCGLDSDEACIFDDYRVSKALPFSFLLRLTDRYPMQVETKGGTVPWNPKIIIFTAPEPPRELFDEASVGDIGQLVRRITLVKHLTVHPQRVRNEAAAAARKQNANRRVSDALAALELKANGGGAAAPAAVMATPSPGPPGIRRVSFAALSRPPPPVLDSQPRNGSVARGFVLPDVNAELYCSEDEESDGFYDESIARHTRQPSHSDDDDSDVAEAAFGSRAQVIPDDEWHESDDDAI